MAFEPSTGALWTVVNERDEIGDDVPPDYLTSVKDGGFYGWPYSYWGKNVDTRVQPQRPDLVANAITPDYALGAHTASLGLAYYDGTELPAPFQGGMFIGQHGSWNRSEYSGYKVIFVPFKDGRPSGVPRRCADRLPQGRRQRHGARPARRRGDRRKGRTARCRRHRQHRLARDGRAAPIERIRSTQIVWTRLPISAQELLGPSFDGGP